MRVENEEYIKMWYDPWLPGGSDFKILSVIIPGLEEIMVHNLFRSDSREWDQDLILNIFNA